MISEIGAGICRQPLDGRHRLPGDVAVDPLHGIGRREWQCPREHLVEHDPERIEVAAGVDRPVHASGLFGRHVGERAGDEFGRCRRLPFARETRGEAEPGEPDLSVRAVHQEMGGLQILVHEAARMELAERSGDAHGQRQEAAHRHGSTEQPLERLAARILEDQHAVPVFALERQGSQRPRLVQHILQAVFVGQTIEVTRAGIFRGGHHDQHGAFLAIIRVTPGSAKSALPILPQDLEVAISLCAKAGQLAHLPNSAGTLVLAIGLANQCRSSIASVLTPTPVSADLGEDICSLGVLNQWLVRLRVISAKKRSTRLSHDDEVGVPRLARGPGRRCWGLLERDRFRTNHA